MRDIYRFIGTVLVVVVALIGGAAIIHILVTLPIQDNKGAEWIGAIGTVGAFAGTIWLAMAEKRQRNRDARDLATVTAAAIAPRLARLIRVVKNSIQGITNASDQNQYLIFERVANSMDGARAWEPEELVALVPLRNHTAAKLALAAAILERTKKSLTGYAAKGSGAPGRYRENVLKHLEKADLALRAGQRECNKLLVNVDLEDL